MVIPIIPAVYMRNRNCTWYINLKEVKEKSENIDHFPGLSRLLYFKVKTCLTEV